MRKTTPVPCETCPRNINRVVDRASGLLLEEDGTVHYGYTREDRRTLGIGWIGSEDLQVNYQDLARSITDCKSPETIARPRSGLPD